MYRKIFMMMKNHILRREHLLEKKLSSDIKKNVHIPILRCCVTEIGVIGECILDKNGPCMMNVITPAITQLNDMSKEFETSFNEGNYTNSMFES